MIDRHILIQNTEGFLEDTKPHFIRFSLDLLYANGKNIDQNDARGALEALYESLLLREIDMEHLQDQLYRSLGHDKLMTNYLVSRSFLFLLERFDQASQSTHPHLSAYYSAMLVAIMRFVTLFEGRAATLQLPQKLDIVFDDNDQFFIHNNILDIFYRIKNSGIKIKFMNLYKGVPIMYEAEILDIDGDEVVFKTDPLQELAMKLDGKAFIVKNEFFDKHVKADIVYSNFANSTVVLNNFIYLLNMPAAQREFVRVHPNTIAQVMLSNNEKEQTVGKLFDLSINGLGVVSEENHGLHIGAKVSVKFDLHFPYDGKTVAVDVKGSVLNVIEYHDSFRYCMCIHPDDELAQEIVQFVKEREEEIIVNLKDQLKEYVF